MENVKEYVNKFTTFGEPVDYKGLKIKPIVVKDAEKFLEAIDVFRIEKDKIPDVNIIKMSYLEFLMGIMAFDNNYVDDFLCLLSLTLGMEYEDRYRVGGDDFNKNELLSQSLPNGDSTYYINGWNLEIKISGGKATIKLMDSVLTANEFEEFIKIVLFQNIDGYDDTPMSDDFRRIVNQYYTLKFKGIHEPTIEDKMMAIIVSSSYTMETIKEMPMRSFERLFDCSVKKVDYTAIKPLERYMKNGVDHWVFYPERDKYSEIFGDANELAKKVTSI